MIITGSRFTRTPDGAVWTSGPTQYSFWKAYLEVFDEVLIAARSDDSVNRPSDARRVDGPMVNVFELPYYVGPWQYLKTRSRVQRAFNRLLTDERDSAFLFRGSGRPSPAGFVRSGYPYGVEIIGDPYDVFAPGAVKHPFRPFFRWEGFREQKSLVQHATAVSYVTGSALQTRYPARSGAFTTHYSDIELSSPAFVPSARTYISALTQPRLSFVGSLEQMYKGLDDLIEATADLRGGGIISSLTVLGDGRHRVDLERQVRSLGLESSVSFVGKVPSGEPVRDLLDQSDIFVMPSRTEGLPRAMIEAMARGLPCIGTQVGGIPELLPSEDMVPANDPKALAAKILEVSSNPQRMSKMSARNLKVAREYRPEILQVRRNEMYSYLKEATTEWQNRTQK